MIQKASKVSNSINKASIACRDRGSTMAVVWADFLHWFVRYQILVTSIPVTKVVLCKVPKFSHFYSIGKGNGTKI